MTAHPQLGGVTVTGTSLDISGSAVIEGDQTVNGNHTVRGNLSVIGTQAVTGAQTFTGLLTATGGMAPFKGFPGTTNPASSSLNAHISTATVTGNDVAGKIVFVSDGSGVAQNQILCVITYASGTLYTAVPVVLLTNMSAGAASTTLHAGGYGVVSADATKFSVVVTGAALTASGTFTCGYHVVGLG